MFCNICRIAVLINLLVVIGCGTSQRSVQPLNVPRAAYELDYNAQTRKVNVQSIDVTPPYSRQNFSGKAGIFQVGGASFNGNLITVTAYITNNDTQPWTGVEVQAYQLLLGNNVTVYNPDFGTGWYVNNPAYGAWGWLFTSGTAGSQFTIPAGGQSVNTINGFYTTNSFRALVYIYADVPVIDSITPAAIPAGTTMTISGYNFSTTQGSVTFNGLPGTVQSWTDNTIVATVPTNATFGNVVVDTVYANTPYSNPVKYTPYSMFSKAASIASPAGITVDTAGNVYVAVYNSNNYIDAFTPAGGIWRYSGTKRYSNPLDVAFDTAGNLYVANSGGNNIMIVPPGGGAPNPFAAVGSGPDALYFSGAGKSWPLYVADGSDGTIYAVASNGTAALFSSSFTNPASIACDNAGNVYVGDCSSGDVYRINAAGTMTATVVTGLSCPSGMKLDAAGNIYILDSARSSIYKYVPSTGDSTLFANLSGIPNLNGGFAFNDTFTTLYLSQDSPTNKVLAIPIQ